MAHYTKLVTDENQVREEMRELTQQSQPPVRVTRDIMVRTGKADRFDNRVIQFQSYNSFNYSLLTERNNSKMRMTLGITSANPQEGKTVTASNLAVALTLGSRRKTVLVDMNIRLPRLHSVFGVAQGPGLVEALEDSSIHISPTAFDNLWVLTSGFTRGRNINGVFGGQSPNLVGAEHTAAFGEIVHSLEQQFDFVIVDMPAINTREFPVLFVNHLDGVLVVVELGRTKRHDIEKIFQQLNKNQVLGFVFNRVRDES